MPAACVLGANAACGRRAMSGGDDPRSRTGSSPRNGSITEKARRSRRTPASELSRRCAALYLRCHRASASMPAPLYQTAPPSSVPTSSPPRPSAALGSARLIAPPGRSRRQALPDETASSTGVTRLRIPPLSLSEETTLQTGRLRVDGSSTLARTISWGASGRLRWEEAAAAPRGTDLRLVTRQSPRLGKPGRRCHLEISNEEDRSRRTHQTAASAPVG